MTKMKMMLITGLTAIAIGATSIGSFAAGTDEMLQLKKDRLSQQVTAGRMTQVQADQIIAAIEEHMKTCDGTGSAKIGQSMGAAFGLGQGNAQGNGQKSMGIGNGQGKAQGQRNGQGQGLRNGSCVLTSN